MSTTLNAEELRNAYNSYAVKTQAITNAHQKAIRTQVPRLEGLKTAELREELIELMTYTVQSGTSKVAVAAADLGEQIFDHSFKIFEDINEERIESSIRYSVGLLEENGLSAVMDEMYARVERELKFAGWNEFDSNKRKGVKYARIVSDGAACSFCIMLSSRGFVYSSANDAGGAGDHYHKSCRCVVVPGEEDFKVDGYDPDDLYRQWQDMIYDKAEQRAANILKNLDTSDSDLQTTIEKLQKNYILKIAKNEKGERRLINRIAFELVENAKN